MHQLLKVCATVGTQHWIYDVLGKDAVSKLHQPWSYEDVVYGHQLGGYVTKFKRNLSFMTVRYAGHEVPSYQPQKARRLFQLFVEGSGAIFDDPDALQAKKKPKNKKHHPDSASHESGSHQRTLTDAAPAAATNTPEGVTTAATAAGVASSSAAAALGGVFVVVFLLVVLWCASVWRKSSTSF